LTTFKPTLVIGATEKTNRFANKAIQSLVRKNHPVFALGKRKGNVEGVEIETDISKFEDKEIDTITLYINPGHQLELYDSMIRLKPKRVIFNPGTENTEFENLLLENNIAFEEACTLVLLNTNQY
jgi:predicted CoA-binding protein